jgi:putative ABC transport system permease protein
LRKLDWDSMRVNFFVLAPPGVLDNYSASYISSFHLQSGREDVMVRLVQRFPNLTTIDVGGFVKQLQETLEQVATAIQLVFAFAVAAGLAVLLAALQSSGDERRHEVAVLRALGARRPQLQRAMAAEFLVLGGLAGLLGGAGAAAIGWTLAKFVFKLDYWPALGMLGQGVVIGWVLVGLAGAWAAVPILRQPPLRTLREAV